MDQHKQLSLTQQQKNQLNKVVSQFPTPPGLIQRTKLYYLQFKSHVGNISSDQILFALKCSFFMAQKSQVLTNMKNEKIRGVGLSLNNLIRSHKYQQILMLKQISRKITIKDQQAAAQIRNIVDEISSLIKFSDKFSKVITKVELQTKNKNTQYQNIFTSLAWLLFVQAKKYIFPNSQQIIDNTCLLCHVISFMIIFGWPFIKPLSFLKSEPRITQCSLMKEISIVVKNKLFEIFKITNLNFYQSVAQLFENFFNQKIQKGIIKHSSASHFLSPQMIDINYKKLDQFYNKNMDINSLDHRIFYKNRQAIFTPSKVTPFYKQGYINKTFNNSKFGHINGGQKQKQNYASFRVLKFDLDNVQAIDPKAPTYTQITKFPKNIIQSPSTANIPLIQTPVAAGMQMYNYLNNKSKKYNQKSQLTQKDHQVLEYIDKFFSKQKKSKSIQDIKKKLVFSLFKAYLAEFNQSFPKDINYEIQQALLALTLEMVCFVNNIHLQFFQIQAQLQLSVYAQWKVCDFLLKSDRLMPIPLKAHILDLEVSIVSQKIWLQEQIIIQIRRFFKQQKTDSPLKRKIQKLCARIIFQLAFQINQISNFLKIPQQFSQKVFQVLKNLLEQHIQIYQNRSIDQLILCSFYLISRIQKNIYTFGQLKQAYFEMNPQNMKDHQKLLIVNTPQYEQNKKLNLIQFYNKFFLHYGKSCLQFSRNEKINENTNYMNRQSNQAKILLQSPLKSIIPRQTNMLNNKNSQTNQNNKNRIKSHLTPQLYAYTESPLLKNQFNSFNTKIPNNSRKVLDYQKEQAKIIQKCSNRDGSQLPQNNQNMDEFFNKRFKQPSFTQKSNIENISPRNIKSPPSRGNSFIQQKVGSTKTNLFANINAKMQNQTSYHLNIK